MRMQTEFMGIDEKTEYKSSLNLSIVNLKKKKNVKYNDMRRYIELECTKHRSEEED